MKILLMINKLKDSGSDRRKIAGILEWAGEHLDVTEDVREAECIVTLGGDGTLLYAMGQYGPAYRYFGINLRHLGFLTSSEASGYQSDMEAVFLKGDFKEQVSQGLMFKGNGYHGRSVNDVVIKSADATKVGDFDVYINGTHVCRPKSDGLSVGGPIMNPGATGFILNNIASHSLSMRPVILGSKDRITVVPVSKGALVVDGTLKGEISDSVEIFTDPDLYHLLRVKDRDFYDVLKRKLHWGIGGGADD